MRIIIIYLMVIFSIFACKKDRLKDDKEIFIGKWKWVYTEKKINTCQGSGSTSYLSPTSENVNYSVEFLKCGKVVYFENEKETSKDRIVFDRFKEVNQVNWPDYLFEYGIDGNNKDNKHIGGVIKEDTLIVIGFNWPHYSNCDCCEIYSYFIRE